MRSEVYVEYPRPSTEIPGADEARVYLNAMVILTDVLDQGIEGDPEIASGVRSIHLILDGLDRLDQVGEKGRAA